MKTLIEGLDHLYFLLLLGNYETWWNQWQTKHNGPVLVKDASFCCFLFIFWNKQCVWLQMPIGWKYWRSRNISYSKKTPKQTRVFISAQFWSKNEKSPEYSTHFKPLNPDISLHILLTVPHILRMVLMRRICLINNQHLFCLVIISFILDLFVWF